MSARASGADSTPNGEARHRTHHDGSAGRAFTAEQKAAVIRIRKCKPTAFYEILGLEEVRTTVTDSEIKKAYRKLSLLTHPDKNGYDGADEAFKMVSRAFQILSDPDKKAQYDKFGHDPDNRFASASAAAGESPFSAFNRSRGARRPMFEEEISPEEIFRQFFGGGFGGFGGPFGFETGPGFVFNLGGGPGIRVHQFGGARPRRRPQNPQEPTSPLSALTSLLPLLLLFVLPLLTSLFSGTTTQTGPSMRFEPDATSSHPHSMQRMSARIKVPYWIRPDEVAEWGPRKLKDLDKQADVEYLRDLQVRCEIERDQQRGMVQEAQGWFWQDEALIEKARRLPMKSCKRLGELRAYR